MLKYKNVLFICLSVVLFIYAGIIGLYPWLINNTLNMDKFESKLSQAMGLNITLGYVNVKITPNFKTVIVIRDLLAKHMDDQPLLDAKYAEILTTPSALFSNKFDIKSLYLKNVTYADQILPNGRNKLEFLPPSINPSAFGKGSITVIPGNMRIKNLKIEYTNCEPYNYYVRSFREKNFTRIELLSFLQKQDFTKVKVK